MRASRSHWICFFTDPYEAVGNFVQINYVNREIFSSLLVSLFFFFFFALHCLTLSSRASYDLLPIFSSSHLFAFRFFKDTVQLPYSFHIYTLTSRTFHVVPPHGEYIRQQEHPRSSFLPPFFRHLSLFVTSSFSQFMNDSWVLWLLSGGFFVRWLVVW